MAHPAFFCYFHLARPGPCHSRHWPEWSSWSRSSVSLYFRCIAPCCLCAGRFFKSSFCDLERCSMVFKNCPSGSALALEAVNLFAPRDTSNRDRTESCRGGKTYWHKGRRPGTNIKPYQNISMEYKPTHGCWTEREDILNTDCGTGNFFSEKSKFWVDDFRKS